MLLGSPWTAACDGQLTLKGRLRPAEGNFLSTVPTFSIHPRELISSPLPFRYSPNPPFTSPWRQSSYVPDWGEWVGLGQACDSREGVLGAAASQWGPDTLPGQGAGGATRPSGKIPHSPPTHNSAQPLQ